MSATTLPEPELVARCDRAFARIVPPLAPMGRSLALGDDLLDRLALILKLRAAARWCRGAALVVVTSALEDEVEEFASLASKFFTFSQGSP